jgi:alpha-beta hydrolase superfamily lysophospholipase
MMANRLRSYLLKWSLYLAGIGAAILGTIVLVYALQARARLGDLKPWHQVVLQEEFSAGKAGAPASFEQYVALEARLFKELGTRILEARDAADSWELGRYNPGSVVAKLALTTPYNHSYVLVPNIEPRGSVLLVHGLSDSPYSMRAMAETFLEQGYYVVSLRMPGHGTLPSGLLDVGWEDWYAAVVLAARHAAVNGGAGRPFVAVGHSTGATLLALYAVRALDDPLLPKPSDLHLVSSAIGISPFAALTNIVSGLSFIPAFEKSRWVDVLPEYDPYKYNSFPVNAGNQIYKLTHVLRDALDARTPEQLAAMPRLHVYHSIVDSTVTSSEVVHGLLARMPSRGHELIAFDINRLEVIEGLITPAQRVSIERMRGATFPFRVTLIANRDRATRAVAAYKREANSTDVTMTELPFEWPAGVFSVGHVSLPFPPDDPVYGLTVPQPAPQFNLGAISAKGENGALVVGLGTFARLRSNPFFEVIRANLIATSGGPPADH